MTAYPSRDCTAVTLPDHLAARLIDADVLAVEDHDCGGFLLFAEWQSRDGWHEVGERLRCFTLPELAEIEGLVLAARKAKRLDSAALTDAADDRNETARREAIRTGKARVKHSENRGGWHRVRRHA